VAFGILAHGRGAFGAPGGGRDILHDRPFRQAGFIERVLDPKHGPAGGTGGGGQTIDVGHDIPRGRTDGVADFVIHEGILQVDDDQRGPFRIEVGEDVLRATPSDDAFDNGKRKRDAIHCGFSRGWNLPNEWAHITTRLGQGIMRPKIVPV